MQEIFSFFTSHIIGLAETLWIVWEVRRAGRKNALASKSNSII